MTKIGPKRIHPVRCRGGNMKFRGIRIDTGNISWGSEVCTRKTRILDVVYNASNNELVRTKTLVKGAIIQVDATCAAHRRACLWVEGGGRRERVRSEPSGEATVERWCGVRCVRAAGRLPLAGHLCNLCAHIHTLPPSLSRLAGRFASGTSRTMGPRWARRGRTRPARRPSPPRPSSAPTLCACRLCRAPPRCPLSALFLLNPSPHPSTSAGAEEGPGPPAREGDRPQHQLPVRHGPSAGIDFVPPRPVRPVRRLHPGGQGARVLRQEDGAQEEVGARGRLRAPDTRMPSGLAPQERAGGHARQCGAGLVACT